MLKRDGRQLLTVGKGTAAVLAGHDDVTTWDDEELAHGRRRDTNGNFTGRPPRLIPHMCWVELKRRQIFDAESTFGKAVAGAAEYLADVAEGRVEPQAGRMQACSILFDRFLGKPKESVNVQMSVVETVEELPWVQALKKAARVAGGTVIPARSTPVDDDIVDAELVEPDLCLCGCGQPPRAGSLYFNARHQAQAEAKARFAESALPADDDPVLTEDEDEFVEDEDDPILTDDE
jgi:hypothetical protein